MNRDKPLEIMTRRKMYNDGIELAMRQQTAGNGVCYAEPILFKEHEKGRMIDPCITITMEEAQNLIDKLWQCGLRPSEGTGSAGSLRATENHLADMRALVFKTPKPKAIK